MVVGAPIGKHIGTSVISNRQLARERYDAKFFYAREKALTNREPTLAAQKVPEWESYKYRVAYWGQVFVDNAQYDQDMSYYLRLAREHDERQPFIQQEILDALIEGHSCHSYRSLSKHINDWCSPWTIEKWFKLHPSYHIYSKNIKPGLSEPKLVLPDPITGKISFAGNAVKHKKGEPYLIDCNVTGMNAGTPQIPCFPLRYLWEHSLFPAIKALTAPDGPCAEAQVVFQEDNAGPHTNHEYAAWMTKAFAEHGWKIELQAPQGLCYPIPNHDTYPYPWCPCYPPANLKPRI
jgi:hypothetical protein